MGLLDDFFKWVWQSRRFSLLVLLETGLLFVIYTNVYEIKALTGMPILDMEIGYSAEQVNHIFNAYGPQGFERYKLIMVADIVHPAVYGTLLGALIWVMADGPRMRWFAALPLFVALFDWAENLMIWKMISAPLPVDFRLAEMGATLSYLKHGTLGLVFLLLIWLLFRRIFQALVY